MADRFAPAVRMRRLRGLGPVRARAAMASVVWAVIVGAYAVAFFGASQARGTTFLDGAFFLVTLALPLILVWVAALLAEELVRQREMVAGLAGLALPLGDALAATRDSLDRHGPASPAEIARAVQGALVGDGGADPALERLAAAQARLESALQALTRQVAALGAATPAETAAGPAEAAARRPRVRASAPSPAPASAPAAAADQQDLPLLEGPDAEAEERLGWDEMIRAFDFPRDADDREGFRALRRALRRRNFAQLLQAAEDVLTLLSQEGVYMEDVACAPADADAWRRFVAGERGAAVATMGGITDPAVIGTARSLMKSDQIFRDTSLFFIRRFDAVLGTVAAEASDAEIAQLADTRSGRAFQMLARASGSFD